MGLEVMSLSSPCFKDVVGSHPKPRVVPAIARIRQESRPVGRVVDLGAGCGVLGLVCGATCGASEVVLVERDPDLAAFCRHNATRAPVPTRVVENDLRVVADALGPADLVVANPPFFEPGEGRPSSTPMARNATHASFGDVHDFARAAAATLSADGTFLLLYPADRVADALEAVVGAGLHPCELWILHARHTGRPFRTWVVARRRGEPLGVTLASTLTDR